MFFHSIGVQVNHVITYSPFEMPQNVFERHVSVGAHARMLSISLAE